MLENFSCITIPMSARVVHKLGLEEDNSNFLLMHSVGVVTLLGKIGK